MLAWRKTSFDALRRNFAWPFAGGVLAGIVGFIFGFRDIYSLLCLILGVFVTLTIASEFFRGARVISARDGTNILSAMGELTMRNTRRYGGYVVHFGMVLVFIGIAGTPFNKDLQKEMAVGDSLRIGPYTILCQNFDHVDNANYESDRATLEVFKNGKSDMMLFPERRLFQASQVTETMVAIQSSPLRDLYVVYAGRSPESGKPVIHAYLQSADQMDLVRRNRGGARYGSGAAAEPPHGAGPAPRRPKDPGQTPSPKPRLRSAQSPARVEGHD